MRITHIGLIGLAWMATLAVVPALAFAQTTPVGKSGDVEFKTTVRVGATLLQPGHYRFQHQPADGQHNLVVRRLEAPTSWLASGIYQVGAEVARIPCTVADGNQKNKKTEVSTRKDDDGTTMLLGVQIAGEKASHIVAMEHQMK